MKRKFLKRAICLFAINAMLLVNVTAANAFSRKWTDNLNDAYFKWEDFNGNQLKMYKDGLFETGALDGIENKDDWKTIYRIKDGKKYYLDSILQNTGFKNIVVTKEQKDNTNYYSFKFKCNDESNNNITFDMYICTGWCSDDEGYNFYEDDIRMVKLYVNNKVPTTKYMDDLAAKQGGIGLLHGVVKIFRIEYGLEKKPAHIDFSKERFNIRNIKEKIGDDFELKADEKDADWGKYFAELYYENSNKDKVRYDEKTLNYKIDKQFSNDDVVAYFDYSVDGDEYDFGSGVMRNGPWGATLQELMKNEGYKISENISTVENAEKTEKLKTMVFTNGSTEMTIKIKCYKGTAIDNKNKQITVDEYAMLTPLIDGKPISYKEWQEMLNDGFYKTHATSNTTRQLVETNIENIYGVGGARNYSL